MKKKIQPLMVPVQTFGRLLSLSDGEVRSMIEKEEIVGIKLPNGNWRIPVAELARIAKMSPEELAIAN